jgi:MFS family permease
MYAAFALGAPVGSALYGAFGFVAVGTATMLVPLVTLAIAARLDGVAPTARVRASFSKVIAAVWVPGAGLALASVGFGAITAFIALLFAEHDWAVWSGFTAFATAFIAARLFLGHLADRVGGAKVALIFALIEGAGQALIWLAPSLGAALVGAALAGFGYSLVYPGFGVEAVHRAPAENRGLAMGAYTAFLDVALGIGIPALGLIASWGGIASVFLTSTVLVLCAAVVAMRLLPSDVHPAMPTPTTR